MGLLLFSGEPERWFRGATIEVVQFAADRAVLPAHPEYAAISAMRDASHLRAVGEEEAALRRVETAWETSRGSSALAIEMIRTFVAQGKLEQVEAVCKAVMDEGDTKAASLVRAALAHALAGNA